MFMINTRQMKVKDLNKKRIKDLFAQRGRRNDIHALEVDDEGNLVITVSDVSTEFLNNVNGVNKNLYSELEKIDVSPDAKIFVQSKEAVEEGNNAKRYPLIDFLADEKQVDEYTPAYKAIRTVVRK